MDQLPVYVSIIFFATTILTLTFFYKASHSSKSVLIISLIWLGIQTIPALAGFYTVTDTTPPRFILLVLPPILTILFLFITKKGRIFLNGLNIRTLCYLHIIRIPVEITLYFLFTYGFIPRLMTFEGINFDIFSGITAPIIVYLVFKKSDQSKIILLLWNFICLGLLINIVVHAVLSAPSGFQKLAFDQPNIAILHFPFIWLPCFIVPVVLLSHLTSIRNIILQLKTKKRIVI